MVKYKNQEVKAMVKKYAPMRKRALLAALVAAAIIGGPIAIGVGIVSFAATGSIGATALSMITGLLGMSALVGAARATMDGGFTTDDNKAQQRVEGREYALWTLAAMERKLQKAYNKASPAHASETDKLAFISLATEVQQDLGKLSPAFKLVSDRTDSYLDADKYTFIVTERTRNNKGITLAEANKKIKTAMKRSAKQN